MFRRFKLRLKIWFLKREFNDIDSQIWSYYISLNIRSAKYFNGKIDVDKEFEHFKRLKLKHKYLLFRKIEELQEQLKNPVK